MFRFPLSDDVERQLLTDLPTVSLHRAARVAWAWYRRICEHVVALGTRWGFRLLRDVSPVRLLRAAMWPMREWVAPRMRTVPLDATTKNRAVGLAQGDAHLSPTVTVATERGVYLRSVCDRLTIVWSAPAHSRVSHVVYACGRIVAICTPDASPAHSEWWALQPESGAVECVRSSLPRVHSVVGTAERIFCASDECVLRWAARTDAPAPEVLLRTDEVIKLLIRCDWCVGALHEHGATWLVMGDAQFGEAPSRLQGPTSCAACVHDAFVVGDFLGHLHLFQWKKANAQTSRTKVRRMRLVMWEPVIAVHMSRTLLVGAGLAALRLWTRDGALVGSILRHTGVGVVLASDDGLTLYELSDQLRVWHPAVDVWSKRAVPSGMAIEGETA